jgi:hypothetical protein
MPVQDAKMRIAISGAHGTGKTSLWERLSGFLPDYESYEEPYYQLEGEGHAFTGAPSLRDFELQLERSIQNISSSGQNGLFDRCPADFLAYLLCHKHSAGFDLEPWMARVREAMATLDHVLYVPIERPDRISIPKSEGRELRRCVDGKLQDLLLENRMGFGCKVTEVTGPLEERVRTALEAFKSSSA